MITNVILKRVIRALPLAVLMWAVAGGSVMAEPPHGHAALHGGALVGLEYDGEEVAHLEMVLDASTGKLTVFLADASAKDPVRVPQELIQVIVRTPAGGTFTVELTAQEDPASGQTSGDTSIFSAEDPRLKGLQRFHAEVVSVFVLGYEVNRIVFDYPEGDH